MKNEYRVPKAVYHQCMWIVKDIDRLLRLETANRHIFSEDEIVFFLDDEDVIKNADVLKEASWKLECIRMALQKLPPEYRQGTIDSINYNLSYKDSAHENTWRKWRQVFIAELAKNLFLL